ncbi:sugar phosphate isomerase/epimerase family protein [Dethiothermospora halolimnae]|uniref:sugar phosphate isomerase/epimerase family protein n=1 Tax=Dethiothermospora halolimnae TaxID=3114390 RepID=UPI003CCC1F4B
MDDNWEDIVLEYQKKLKDFNGIVSLHSPCYDLNPGSTDKKILDVTRYRYLQAIKYSKLVGASYIIFHCQMDPLLKVPEVKKRKLDNHIKFWKDMINNIEDTDITFLLENEYDYDYKDLLYVLKGVDSPRLKCCLDTGHVLAYSGIDIEEWVKNLKEHVKYVHLHWNDGNSDAHQRPNNEFLLYIKEIFNEYNINPIITLEYYGLKDIVSESKRIRKVLY